MKRIFMLFLWFYCTYSQSVLNIPNEKPGSSANVTVESPVVYVKTSISHGGLSCDPACFSVSAFAGTDMFGNTTWVNNNRIRERFSITECTAKNIERVLKGERYVGKVRPSAWPGLLSPSKGSYRIYGACNNSASESREWYTNDRPWDGIPPPVCGLTGPDVIDFGELKAAAIPGKSKKAFYNISCDKKATVKVIFVFATGESTAKLADDLTLALTVGTQDGVTGENYTVEESAVQTDLTVALKSGGTTPPGVYQASAVVKMTVE